jgi:adenylosuccinate synthase
LRAYIVLDLGFGDAGKGLLTDTLVRQAAAGVVVRYNGGAQAGHNVVTPDGRHHTFAQFGAGSFVPGVKTFLSRHMIVHPGALLVEGDILMRKGVCDAFERLRISRNALVITPFHQAANRIRELMRGGERHGSCGVGVGEAYAYSLTHDDESVRARDLLDPVTLWRKLAVIRAREMQALNVLCADQPMCGVFAEEWEVFTREDVIDNWIEQIARIGGLGLVAPDTLLADWLSQTETVVFEGAQGILLDGERGFHPYTTWSDCTAKNALDLIADMAPDADVVKMGVLRSHAVRHGPGPLPTETQALAALVPDHNQLNDWQGAVRYGWFDAVLARYALDAVGGVDTLVVTHMDLLPHLDAWQYCAGYEGLEGIDDLPVSLTIKDGLLMDFRLPPTLTLEQRAQFTQVLSGVQPVIERCAADEGTVILKMEALLGRPVEIVSRGARAGDVEILKGIPK